MIHTEKLRFIYPHSQNEVLKSIDLYVTAGSFVAIIGANGSGKTTLVQHFNALLLPSGGRVYIMGLDSGAPEHLYDIRRNMGLVWQNPDNQIVTAIVEEDVAFGLENLGIPSKQIRQLVDEALKATGLYDYRHHATYMLSGGQKQKLALAGILAMRPRCIVLDEATSMLDPQGREEVMAVVKRLQEIYGITVVMITHHMEEAALADRIVVLAQGQVEMDGTPAQIFSRVEELALLGLAAPVLAELMYRLNRCGVGVKIGITDVETCAREILAAYNNFTE